ncbi:hypothetical protein B0H17DRAFT_939361, partial [Mycena rosella]
MPELQPVSDSEDESKPVLQAVSDSDDESDGDSSNSDWFSEVGEDGDGFEPSCGSSEELSGVDGSECDSFVDVDLDSDSVGSWDYVRDALETATQDQAAAVTKGQSEKHSPRSELYDSGTTRHITPFRDELNNFVEIPPRSFSAANKSGFSAVGQGDMVIDVPNG